MGVAGIRVGVIVSVGRGVNVGVLVRVGEGTGVSVFVAIDSEAAGV